jgi:hypothetical protein
VERRLGVGCRSACGRSARFQLLAAFTFALHWALSSRVARAPILDEWLMFTRVVFA